MASFQSYDLVADKDGFDFDAYMERQPNQLATFDRHAEAEAEFFKRIGLMCNCDEPAPAVLHCQLCEKPVDRLTVLAAELTTFVPDGITAAKAKKSKR